MNFGICPNCVNKLTEDSALMTKMSSIFKGNNHYLMCKNCQQVLLYNRDRDMIFDLDEYKEEQDILDEINALLSEIDNHYEVSAPCQHDCSKCAGECETKFKRASKERKAKPVESQEKPVQDVEVSVVDILEGYFLAVNKQDPNQKKLLTENEFGLIDINEWIFFELKHVDVEPVVSFKIIRY